MSMIALKYRYLPLELFFLLSQKVFWVHLLQCKLFIPLFDLMTYDLTLLRQLLVLFLKQLLKLGLHGLKVLDTNMKMPYFLVFFCNYILLRLDLGGEHICSQVRNRWIRNRCRLSSSLLLLACLLRLLHSSWSRLRFSNKGILEIYVLMIQLLVSSFLSNLKVSILPSRRKPYWVRQPSAKQLRVPFLLLSWLSAHLSELVWEALTSSCRLCWDLPCQRLWAATGSLQVYAPMSW